MIGRLCAIMADLVRKLLLQFEQRPTQTLETNTQFAGHSENDIQYHLILLAQADLIQYEANRSSTNPDRIINVYQFGLTWNGHEFLDVARDENTWKRAKRRALDETGDRKSVGKGKSALTREDRGVRGGSKK